MEYRAVSTVPNRNGISQSQQTRVHYHTHAYFRSHAMLIYYTQLSICVSLKFNAEDTALMTALLLLSSLHDAYRYCSVFYFCSCCCTLHPSCLRSLLLTTACLSVFFWLPTCTLFARLWTRLLTFLPSRTPWIMDSVL
jgi:hypothetical protein